MKKDTLPINHNLSLIFQVNLCIIIFNKLYTFIKNINLNINNIILII